MDRSRETLPSFYVADTDLEPFQPSWPEDCPQPGIYRDVPYETYKAWPAVNATALKAGVDLSPLHMREAIDGYRSDTKDKRFGRAEHVRFLEPHAYAERILIAQPCCQPLKSGRRKGRPCGVSGVMRHDDGWFCRTHAPPEAIEPTDYIQPDEAERIERAWQAVTRHRVVALMRASGGCEVSLVWEREGVPCKARLDKLIEKGPDGRAWILDLKKVTAWKIDDRSINRQIADLHYDLQAAWYISGVEAVLGSRTAFAWVFAEDGPPFDVRPKVLTRGWCAGGMRLVDWAFGLYRRSLETGEWPGVSPGWDEEGPPEWYLRKAGIRL